MSKFQIIYRSLNVRNFRFHGIVSQLIAGVTAPSSAILFRLRLFDKLDHQIGGHAATVLEVLLN